MPIEARNTISAGAVLAAFALAVGVGMAAEPAKPDAPAPEKHVFSNDETAGIGATTLFLNGFSGGSEVYTELTYLSAGEGLRFWTFYDPNYIRKITATDVNSIEDQTPLPKDPGDRELQAYFDMLIFAHRTSPEALDKAALRQDDLWTQLFRAPEKYHGELVHFEGKLKKLRRFDVPSMAVQGGVTDYYEGYMDIGPRQDDPLFIQITELPPGLKPGDALDESVGVSGYFYKIFRYKAVDTKETHKDRLAPMVIGRTVTFLGPPKPPLPEDAGSDWPLWLGPLFFAGILLTLAVLFSVGYWYRNSDRHVRGRLIAARHGEFIPPPDDAPPDPRRKSESEPPAGD